MQEAAERPSVAPYVPHAQFVQEDAPLRLYEPAVQVRQVDEVVAPIAVLYVPAKQLVQTVAPTGLYFPAGQRAHMALVGVSVCTAEQLVGPR